MRARRSCLSVPASRERFLEKAEGIGADELIFDLEDSVAPSAKAEARALLVRALRERDYSGRTRAVRVNDCSTRWCHQDVIEVVEGAGDKVDTLVVPKVEGADQVRFLDILLTQVEERAGLPRRLGLELQIESALGLERAFESAAASNRAEALIFGPLDLSADLRLPGLDPGTPPAGYPGDFWHYFMARILTAARAHGLQVVDGPWFRIQDVEGLRAAAARSAAFGYDGKWALNPVQVEALNEAFSPRPDDVDKAFAIVEAYRRATEQEATGAVMLGDEMIDEASRKLAQVTVERAQAFGIQPRPWKP